MDVRECTQQKLAKQIFVARTTVNGYCTGHRMPSCELLRSIAIELNVTTDYLLGLDDHIKIE
ncbi:MAG: helix-turn-helix transcriptional regulator [Lachnospiraceae bacterium]|nr:helix-turn-helix transcriptional regulator [Lachnospiraceae bacterium]